MEPFTAALDSFHERTAPGDWLEGLVKAYVGDGIAEDFYREVSAYVDTSTRDLVLDVLEDTGHSTVRRRPGPGGHRPSRSAAGRPARAVGPPAGRRGAEPGSAGRGRAGRALDAAGRRVSTAVPTWPRSAGCSPGSPRTTPGGWPALGLVRLTPYRG